MPLATTRLPLSLRTATLSCHIVHVRQQCGVISMCKCTHLGGVGAVLTCSVSSGNSSFSISNSSPSSKSFRAITYPVPNLRDYSWKGLQLSRQSGSSALPLTISEHCHLSDGGEWPQ
eukprot:13947-Heterococcus_DN1.PRE.5